MYPALLLAKLFVELIFKLSVQAEVLNGSPLAGFLQIRLDSEFSLEIELWNTLKLFFQSTN